jgi:hypothetical protein
MKKKGWLVLTVFCTLCFATLANAEYWYPLYESKEVWIPVKIVEHNSDSSAFETFNEYYHGHLIYDHVNFMFYFKPVEGEWVAGSKIIPLQTWSGTKKDKLILMGVASYEDSWFLYVDLTGKMSNSYGYVDSIDVTGNIVAISKDSQNQTKLTFKNVKMYPVK